MLKPGITSKDISIYELYLQRMQKESDLIWSRFKIYFGFNSGLLAVIGFLLKLDIPLLQNIRQYAALTIILLSIVGFIFSVAWFLINYDGKHWQTTFNTLIADLEKQTFINPSHGMYNRINQSAKWYDVLNINLFLSGLFIVLWSVSICALILIKDII